MRLVNRFVSDRRGTAAILFGLTLVPLVGFAGAAVDYGRASSAKAQMQRAADATALHLARESLLGRSQDVQMVFDGMLHEMGVPVRNMVARATPTGVGGMRVDATAVVPMTLASLILPTLDVGVTATAAAERQTTPFEIERANLSVEAADYNELRIYCFNEIRNERLGVIRNDTGLRERDFLTIANNTDEGVATAAETLSVRCGAGEALSYHLINIRNARTSPSRAPNSYDSG